MEIDEYIELYSKTRNRLLYPNPSSFEVPYAPTSKVAENPVINGTIYYKFSYQPGDDPIVGVFRGSLSVESNLIDFYLDPSMTPYYPLITNFFVGYNVRIDGTTETRVVTAYDPTSGRLTLDKPWSNPFNYPSGSLCRLYLQFPTFDHISIPTVDLSGNIGLDFEGAYNGYYVIFESNYKAYSNEYNSNIFYRQITYYDNKTRLAYFDKPINFDYKDIFGYEDLDPQFITLRKTLPLERWPINSTYINTTPPSNPLIGPLLGPVITLPKGASEEDNYYKGKYVYYYGNAAYYGDINFIRDLELKDQFYPIYGFYFIKAYNGKTRELSIEQDINNISCNQSLPNIPLPGLPTKVSLYNSSSLIGYSNATVSQVSGDVYRAYINLPDPFSSNFTLSLNPPGLGPSSTRYWEKGKEYTVRWRFRKSPIVDFMYIVKIEGAVPDFFVISQEIKSDYTTLERKVVFNGNYIDFVFSMSYVDPIENPYLEWDYFEVIEDTIINITDFDKDSYSPFDYIGTTVSSNQDVCYEISLSSLTLPNLSLKTGSKIAFYPYVYVEFSNVTSPNNSSTEIIYSNNPNSNIALFIVPVGLLVNPNSGTFLTLYSDMTQYIKFKPNDNLKFSVYLPNGEPFETFINDTFPPYEPDSRVQIEAVFRIVRKLYLN